MDKDILRAYYFVLKGLGQLLNLIKLYNTEHPVFKERADEIFSRISAITQNKQVLSLAESGGLFLVNGEKIEPKDSLVKRFIESFQNLQLGSLDIEHGMTIEELVLFVRVLNQSEHLKGEAKIREFLKEKGTTHIIPRFATYKLVREDEKVVREGGVVNISELPPEIINKFSEDLHKGDVGVKLKKKEKAYNMLAHDPAFLSSLAFDMSKKNDSPDSLIKALWLVGDYLVNEISSVREEETNRKILEDFKERLLKMWEGREDKDRWHGEIHKTFSIIGAAVELKGLMSLYQKHKKGVEGAARKLARILEALPPDSQLYIKTKASLDAIGAPSISGDLFK